MTWVRCASAGMAVCLVAAGAATAGQRSNTAAIRARLANPAPLDPSEISDLLQAAREAVAYRTLRLSMSPTGLPGPEVMMDSDGRPKFVYTLSGGIAQAPGQRSVQTDVETFTHYTRQAARSCDGARVAGEL